MNVTVFERLLYTDCRAGQGRGGGGGFQIQAQSAGVTASLARIAVNNLLYIAPTEWLTTRAVEDFPLGLAHASGEGWGTSQSRYVGKEATGSRSGNHLADCLLAADHTPYGTIRPAQLFESDFWRSVPFETTECPPFDDFLEPGPLTNDDLQEWLRADDGRAEVLGRLVTVLEDPKGPQVVIVATTTEEAVRWIAAATVLLPIETALDVTFKVFVTDLNRSPQRIVGAPKELNPNLRLESPGGRFVIDGNTGQASGGEVSERALYWVRRLVEADDPYDVVGAVDFAPLLVGSGHPETAEARETAWLITAESEPLSDPEPLVRWLQEPKDPELGEHESAAARRLVASGLLDSGTLGWMEGQADADRLYVDRVELRRALLTAEIREAELPSVTWLGDLTAVDIGDGPRRDAESAISSALLLSADDATVDRLLRIAWRHAVPLALPPLRERLDTFVAGWIAEPRLRYDPAKWALSDYLLEELMRQLIGDEGSAADRGPNLAAARPLLEQAWPYLLRLATDSLQPLTWELLAASASTSVAGARERELERSIEQLGACGDPARALTGFQRALVRWNALSRQEAVAFVSMMPVTAQLHPDIADQTIIAIRRGTAAPDARLLDAIQALERRHLLPFNPATDDLSSSDRMLTAFRNSVRQLTSMEELERLPDLGRIDPRVLRVRAPDLVEATLDDEALPLLGGFVLASVPAGRGHYFIDAWSRWLSGERGVTAAARGYLWCESSKAELPGFLRREIADQLGRHAVSMSEAEKAEWIRSVGALLGPAAGGFESFLGGPKRRPHLHVGRSKRD